MQLTTAFEFTDEYQIEIPEKLIRFKEFNTGIDDPKLVKIIISDVEKSKKLKKAGEEYKSAKTMCEEYNVDMNQLRKVIKAKEESDNLSGGRFVLSGKSYYMDNGSVGRAYSRTGELMVKAIEEAYIEMGFRVPISGEYLVGRNWSECH